MPESPDHSESPLPFPDAKTDAPESQSGLLSQLTHSYGDRMKEVLRRGQKKLELLRSRPFPYKVEDIPEGQAGLDWMVKHREEIFPWVQKEIQFDNGGAPPGSRFYFEGVKEYQERAATQGYAHWGKTHEVLNRGRSEAAALLGADSDEIAFVQNTATGLNFVAQGIEWEAGDEIVVVRRDKEYPTNFLPWQQLEKKGVKIVEVGDENGFISPDEIHKALSPKTRLVALSSVGWKSGQRVDLKSIGKMIQTHNSTKEGGASKPTRFCVDAIQSLGSHELDVKACGIDFLSAGGSKWLLADQGNGIFYCSKDAIDDLPNAPLGASSLQNFQDSNSPRKMTAQAFETGMLNAQGVNGLASALSVINKVGIGNIEKRTLQLTDRLEAGLRSKGYFIFSPRTRTQDKTGMVLFSKPEWEQDTNRSGIESKIKAEMKDVLYDPQKPAQMSVRDGRLRACVHYYNTKEEIDELLRKLPDVTG